MTTKKKIIRNKRSKIKPVHKVLKKIINDEKKEVQKQKDASLHLKSLDEQYTNMMAFHLEKVKETTGTILPIDITYCNDLKTRMLQQDMKEFKNKV